MNIRTNGGNFDGDDGLLDDLMDEPIQEPVHVVNDDIEDIDPLLQNPEPQQNPESVAQEPQTPPTNTGDGEEEFDAISELLAAKGIKDPNSIKFTNDEGELVTRSWDELSAREQFNILNTSTVSNQTEDLEDSEIDLLNEIRQNGMTTAEYLEYVKQEAIQQYLQEQSSNDYEVDSVSDDELFKLDLQAKIPDLSDEEAQAALEHEKQNAAIFTRKMEVMRNEYKQYEEQTKTAKQAEQEAVMAAQAEQFNQSIVGALNSAESYGGFELGLEEEDMQEIYSFITDTDKTGARYFAKALSDPDTLVKMAWFALKGDEALKSIQDYYSKEIAKTSKEAFEKGKQSVSKPTGNKPASKLSIKTSKSSNNNNFPTGQKITSIDQLD